MSDEGRRDGTDIVQALGHVSSMDALSNTVTVTWAASSGSGTTGGAGRE